MSKVHFVGAGSGAADLITVRGERLLRKADVVIYAGSLVNPDLLGCVKKECEVYNSAYLYLEQIIGIMRQAVRAGKEVVRLHTGDTSIYSAVREQADRLEALGIDYDICPGVSSFQAAAAGLGAEYTLPGVSQTVILTRVAGKTPVPESERLRLLASHGSSMAIFLSASMGQSVQEELMASGAYDENTPCAVLYKVSWNEEEKYVTTLGNLANTIEENGIKKTAIILVGDFLGSKYELSKLYDKTFGTEYRNACESSNLYDKTFETQYRNPSESACAYRISVPVRKRKGSSAHIAGTQHSLDENAREIALKGKKVVSVTAVAFTGKGRLQRERVRHVWSESGEEILLWKDANKLNGTDFQKSDVIIFFCASGIAIRMIAPYLKDKNSDPAVIVTGEDAGFAIPLVSGHVGGANKLAKFISRITGATPVITTATDTREMVSPDVWAKENHLAASDAKILKEITALLLREEDSNLQEDNSPGRAHSNPREEESSPSVARSNPRKGRAEKILRLTPKKYVIGFGCKKGIDSLLMEDFLMEFLKKNGIDLKSIDCICSIEKKSGEESIKNAAKRLGVPFVVFTPQQLMSVEGEFSSSDFVMETVGVDCVCERSAVAGAGIGGRLIVRKTARDGITAALAQRDDYCEELELLTPNEWIKRMTEEKSGVLHAGRMAQEQNGRKNECV